MERVGVKIVLPKELAGVIACSDSNVELLVRRYENGAVEVDVREENATWSPIELLGECSFSEVEV